MLTGGMKGFGMPEAYTGSHDQVHQVVKVDRRNRSFTVTFAAYNETGYESLAHVLPDRANGWQQGTLRQFFYWTVTVNE